MSRATKARHGNIKALKQKVWERDGYKCKYCGRPMKEDYDRWTRKEIKRKECQLTVDHVLPRSKGGFWEMKNLVTCCRKCNEMKGNQDWSDVLHVDKLD